MVVVSIIGILASIGIPKFNQYQAKSKSSEAKIKLASIYQAEVTLQSEFSTFATCLGFMGIAADTNAYYALGFNAENSAANGAVNTNGNILTCVAGAFQFDAAKGAGGTPMEKTDLSNATCIVGATGSTFQACAKGAIDSAKSTAVLADEWTINQNKNLINSNKGY